MRFSVSDMRTTARNRAWEQVEVALLRVEREEAVRAELRRADPAEDALQLSRRPVAHLERGRPSRKRRCASRTAFSAPSAFGICTHEYASAFSTRAISSTEVATSYFEKCWSTPYEKTTSNVPSAKGSRRPSATTYRASAPSWRAIRRAATIASKDGSTPIGR